MEKTHTTFAVKIGIIIAILIVVGGAYALFRNDTAPTPIAHLQEVPYIDTVVGYSINLPEGWTVQEKEDARTSVSTWFHNASSTDGSDMKIAIERFLRTPQMNVLIDKFGTEAYAEGLIESLWVDLDLNILKNERMTIGGAPFVHIHSVYVGKESKREATQHMYFTFTEDYYYRIGIDAYTDTWEKNKEDLLASVQTFKVLTP